MLFLMIIESGSITSDQITEMSDWNQGYLMAQFESQTGVQMEADTFATALEGWKASLEECGDYESHKDYEFEASFYRCYGNCTGNIF